MRRVLAACAAVVLAVPTQIATATTTAAPAHAPMPRKTAPGMISGRVTDADGHPLRNVVVSWQPPDVYLPSDFGPFFLIAYDTPTARTDANGTYTFPGWGANAIVPCFDPSHATGGDNDALGYLRRCATESAAPARGKVANLPTVALTSAQGAALRGEVTDRAGRPAPDGSIELIKRGGSYQDYAYADRQGRFVATGEPAGRYRLCGDARSGHGLGLLHTCRTLTLVAGRSTQAYVRLRPGGAASGRMIGPSGHGVPRLDVTFDSVPSRAHAYNYGRTSRTGYFTVGGLPTGNYKMCWNPNQSSVAGDPTGVGTGCLAHTVRVVVGRIQQGLRARPARGGAVAGQVSGIGHKRSYVFAEAERENGGRSALVGQHGHFRLTDLTPGVAYRVCAESLDLYNDRQVCHPRRLTATRGGTLRGVDLHFPTVTRIRVTVTDTSGHRLSGVEVAALQPCRGQWCPRHPVFGSRGVTVNGVDMTNPRGLGTIVPTHGGKFAVCALAYYAATPAGASPTGYADKCTGSTFSVTAPRDAVTAVHIVLRAGAIVTGQVVNAHGDPIPNAQMHLSGSPVDDLSPDVWSYFTDSFNMGPDIDSVTDAQGRYTIHSVRPGQAKLCARNATGYQDGCLSNNLTLTGGSVTNAPNLQLAAGSPGNRPTMRSAAPNTHRPVRRVTVTAINGRLVVRPNHS